MPLMPLVPLMSSSRDPRMQVTKARRRARRAEKIPLGAISRFELCTVAHWAAFRADQRAVDGDPPQPWQHVLPTLHSTDVPRVFQGCCCAACRSSMSTPRIVVVCGASLEVAHAVAQSLQASPHVDVACPIMVQVPARLDRESRDMASAQDAMEQWVIQTCGAVTPALQTQFHIDARIMAVVAVHAGHGEVSAMATPGNCTWFTPLSRRRQLGSNVRNVAHSAFRAVLARHQHCLLGQHRVSMQRSSAATYHHDSTV